MSPQQHAADDVEALLPKEAAAASYGSTQLHPIYGNGAAARDRDQQQKNADDEEEEDGLKDVKSLMVIYWVVAIGDFARGIFFPTLSSYVLLMGGSTMVQGWAVAGFSLGRVLSAPILGTWSTIYGYRLVLLGSCSVIALGSLMYALASSTWMLLAAQICMGVGSGTLGVTRAYVADRTSDQQRTYMLAYLTAVQYGGFTCTPVLGSLLCKLIGEHVESNFIFSGWLRWEWSQFTAPGVFLFCGCAVTMLLLLYVFEDSLAPEKKAAKRASSTGKTATTAAAAQLEEEHQQQLQRQQQAAWFAWRPTKFQVAIFGGFLLNVASKGTIACYETLGAQFAIAQFQLSHAKVGLLFSTFGLLGVCSLLSMRWLCQRFNDVQLIVGGLSVMLVSCTLIMIDEDDVTFNTFLLSIFLQYSIGYPIGHTAVIGLFSKVVGKRPQGTLLGLFGSAGSLARILFPVAAGTAAVYGGPNVVFAGLCVVLAATVILLVSYRNTYLKYCVPAAAKERMPLH